MPLFVVSLVLDNKNLQFLMNAIPAQPVTVNELLTCSSAMSNKSGCHFCHIYIGSPGKNGTYRKST